MIITTIIVGMIVEWIQFLYNYEIDILNGMVLSFQIFPRICKNWSFQKTTHEGYELIYSGTQFMRIYFI